jgi:hypothetical protein
VHLAVLIARDLHRGTFDHRRQFLAWHVGIDPEAERLALVVHPERQGLGAQGIGARIRPVPHREQAA